MFIMNWNEIFYEGVKWNHIAHSIRPVAGHYKIMNSSSAKYVHCVRSENDSAMLLTIHFSCDVM